MCLFSLQMESWEYYKELFFAINGSKTGKIMPAELREALFRLGVDMALDTTMAMIQLVDRDGDCQLTLREFVHFLYILQHAKPNCYASILFLATDDNYSMQISQERFQLITQKLTRTMDNQQIAQLFARYGPRQQHLSYEQFLECVEGLGMEN